MSMGKQSDYLPLFCYNIAFFVYNYTKKGGSLMNKKLKKWSIVGFVFVVLFGVFGHFLYDLTGQNALVGRFFPVNESTWEHLKLLFFPFVSFWVVELFAVGKNYKNFAFAGLVGALSGILFIVAAFYTYTGVLGRNVDFLNIMIFVAGVAISFLVEYKILSGGSKITLKIPSIIILVLLAVLFVLFTNNPPQLGVFKDPTARNYEMGDKKLL